MTEITDQELVNRTLGGYSRSFEELVTRYERKVYKLMYRMVSDAHDVEDLTQETFLRVFRSLDTFKPEFAFSTWIYRIASNTAVDHLRRKKKFIDIHNRISREIPSETEDVSENNTRAEIKHSVAEALDRIPSLYKQVIILKYTENMSVEEIAGVMDIPEGTVKTYLYRGRQELKTRLERTC